MMSTCSTTKDTSLEKRMKKPSLGDALSFEAYDSRNYEIRDVVAGYRGWSEVYDARMDDRLDLDLLAHSALTAAGRVVDLACGTGRIGAWLKTQHEVVLIGVDLSPNMLTRAEARGIYDQLIEGDICATKLEGGFDGAITSMALCHVPSLEQFFTEAARLLKPGGWLVVVDYHPYFLFSGIPSHYDDPETGESIAVRDHPHPHSEYFMASRADFEMVEFRERFVDPEWIASHPSFVRHQGRPVTFMMGFRRR